MGINWAGIALILLCGCAIYKMEQYYKEVQKLRKENAELKKSK